MRDPAATSASASRPAAATRRPPVSPGATHCHAGGGTGAGPAMSEPEASASACQDQASAYTAYAAARASSAWTAPSAAARTASRPRAGATGPGRRRGTAQASTRTPVPLTPAVGNCASDSDIRRGHRGDVNRRRHRRHDKRPAPEEPAVPRALAVRGGRRRPVAPRHSPHAARRSATRPPDQRRHHQADDAGQDEDPPDDLDVQAGDVDVDRQREDETQRDQDDAGADAPMTVPLVRRCGRAPRPRACEDYPQPPTVTRLPTYRSGSDRRGIRTPPPRAP